MKRLKKAGALVLALLMTFVFAIPAMAAEVTPETTYSITIRNENAGHTYQAYQIFKGDVSSDAQQDGNTSGPILSNITWGSGVNGEDLLAALKAANSEKYGNCTTAKDVAEALGAENATSADAEAFADVVAKHLTTVAGTANAPTDGVYTISGLAAGYYLVKDQDGSLQGDKDEAYTDYIVQVLGNTTMAPKSEVPSVEKKVYEQDLSNDNTGYGPGYNDVADWDIGDSIPFKLIGTVPDMSAYDTYTYVFHDTLSEGLTVRNDPEKGITVYVANDRNVASDQMIPVDPDSYRPQINGQNLTITFEDLKTAMTAPGNNQEGRPVSDYKYILVNYDAYLDSDAEIGLPGNPNAVYLEYSNNPNGTGTGTTTTDQVIVFTYELDGTKVDGADNTTKLKDAQFVLLNRGNQVAAVDANGTLVGWVSLPEGEIPDTMTYADWTEFNGRQGAGNQIILTSDEEGLFKVSGLEDDTYYLREIQAPTGYNLLEDDVQVVITATTANGQEWNGEADKALTGLTVTANGVNGTVDTNRGVASITIANNQGSTLPETGGMGTTVFYVVGGVIVAGVLVLLVAKRRMGRAE